MGIFQLHLRYNKLYLYYNFTHHQIWSTFLINVLEMSSNFACRKSYFIKNKHLKNLNTIPKICNRFSIFKRIS